MNPPLSEPLLLRGRNIAVLSDEAGLRASMRLEQAARALGATVARPAPGAMGYGTARLLARLYDAIACEGGCIDGADRLAQDAGVPVLVGIAHEHHPGAARAALRALVSLAGRPPCVLVLHGLQRCAPRLAEALVREAQELGCAVVAEGDADASLVLDGNAERWQAGIAGQAVDAAHWQAAFERERLLVIQAELLDALG